MKTGNMKPLNSITRLTVYYPIATEFNKVPQKYNQMFLYGVDLLFAPCITLDMWHYVYINMAIGPHLFYQLTDDWHFLQAGAEALLGIEWPVARHWTVTASTSAALDYANLGSNSSMMPIDVAWDYQVNLAARYSKKGTHRYSYTGD